MLSRFKRNIVRSFDGTLIAYESSGEGVPLVLCNGVGCNTYVWKYLLPYFQERHRIITWDYRGHGRSAEPVSLEDVTLAAVVADLRAVLADDGIEQAVLIGHSMGSQVILEYYRTHPEQVLGLVSICGSFEHVVSSFPNGAVLSKHIDSIISTLTTLSPVLAPAWRWLLPKYLSYFVATLGAVNGHLLNPMDFRPYFQHLAVVNPYLFLRYVRLLEAHTARDLLPHVEVPALLVAGDDDTMVPPHVMKEMSDLLQVSDFLLVPRGTHVAPIEQPDLVNLRIERFLEERVLGKGAATGAFASSPETSGIL